MPLVLSMALWGYEGMGTSVRWVVGSPCLLQGVFEDRCRRNHCSGNRRFLTKFSRDRFSKLLSTIFKINHAS
jgi:hypothetical protein